MEEKKILGKAFLCRAGRPPSPPLPGANVSDFGKTQQATLLFTEEACASVFTRALARTAGPGAALRENTLECSRDTSRG